LKDRYSINDLDVNVVDSKAQVFQSL